MINEFIDDVINSKLSSENKSLIMGGSSSGDDETYEIVGPFSFGNGSSKVVKTTIPLPCKVYISGKIFANELCSGIDTERTDESYGKYKQFKNVEVVEHGAVDEWLYAGISEKGFVTFWTHGIGAFQNPTFVKDLSVKFETIYCRVKFFAYYSPDLTEDDIVHEMIVRCGEKCVYDGPDVSEIFPYPSDDYVKFDFVGWTGKNEYSLPISENTSFYGSWEKRVEIDEIYPDLSDEEKEEDEHGPHWNGNDNKYKRLFVFSNNSDVPSLENKKICVPKGVMFTTPELDSYEDGDKNKFEHQFKTTEESVGTTHYLEIGSVIRYHDDDNPRYVDASKFERPTITISDSGEYDSVTDIVGESSKKVVVDYDVDAVGVFIHRQYDCIRPWKVTRFRMLYRLGMYYDFQIVDQARNHKPIVKPKQTSIDNGRQSTGKVAEYEATSDCILCLKCVLYTGWPYIDINNYTEDVKFVMNGNEITPIINKQEDMPAYSFEYCGPIKEGHKIHLTVPKDIVFYNSYFVASEFSLT